MPTTIVFRAGDFKVEGYLDDSPTALALAEALPITGNAHLWGDEIYFAVPGQPAGGDPAGFTGEPGGPPLRRPLLPQTGGRRHPGAP
jgi:hypothetical protein